jgi:transcriptional regulator with XRE-family HTH domain
MKSIIHIEKIEAEGVVFHNIKIEIDNIKAHLPGPCRPNRTSTYPGGGPAAEPAAPRDRRTLKTALAGTGLTTKQLADLFGVSVWSIRAWCLGDNRPKDEKIAKIAQLLDMTPKEVSRLLPRRRPSRTAAKRVMRTRKSLGYAIAAYPDGRFVANDGHTAVTFTVRKMGQRTVLDQIETGKDSPLGKKIARDGKISGFGRVCQAARLNTL